MSVSTETAGEWPAVGLPWIITASSVGTLIEWYDFYLYGVLALFFSRHFFSPEPALDTWTAAKDRNVKLPRFRGVELDVGDYGSVVTASIAAS
jgi:hypothetical protein